MRFWEQESGQALVITAICVAILLGMAGMAVDIGLLYRARQNVRIAADAAAVAAAIDYLYKGSASSAQTAGQAASTANGFINGANGVTVTINVPPASGPDAGQSNFAEAIVKEPNPVSFMSLFGYTTVNVAARAVAGMPNPANACIWLMAPSGTGLALQGSYVIDTGSCGIYVNSPSSDAITVTGAGGTVDASFLDAVGDVNPQHQTTPTPITANMAARKNPFGNLSGPSVPSGCSVTSSLTSITTSNQPTESADGEVVCFTSAVTLNDQVTLPGASGGVTYVFENGVTIPTGATVTFGSSTYDPTNHVFSNTSGATMEIEGGTLNQQSSSVLNIYAPTAGTYNGIAILQPSSNTNDLQVQFGSSNEVLDGYIYAPAAEVYLQDNGGGVKAMGIVANTMTNKSSNITFPSYDAANYTTTPNREIILVE